MTLQSQSVKSATLLAMISLLIMDIWIAKTHPLASVTTTALERTEIFNAVEAYKKEPSAPEIVFLGSSLVTAPIMQADASYLKQPLPRMTHRHCEILEHNLSQQLSAQTKIFCLAVGGEMASDAYLITKNILKPPVKPAAIVYGIAPRDLLDNLLPSIDASETFQIVAQLEDLPEFLTNPTIVPERKASIVLARISMLWRYKSDIRTYLLLRIKKLLEKLLPFLLFEKYGETLELKPQRKGQFPEEAIGTPKAYPNLPLDHKSESATNQEYMRRYNPPNFALFNTELEYFKRTIHLCQERQIKVVVVNMPLSLRNKALLKNGVYEQYLQRTSQICKEYNAKFLDMNKNPWDGGMHFVDTVHLTPKASGEFLRCLTKQIINSPLPEAIKSSHKIIASKFRQQAI